MALDTVASRSKRRRLPSVDVPRVQDDELRRSLEALKEHIRMYEGDSGAPKERFVTIEELEKAGLIGTKLQNNFALIDSVAGNPVAQGQQSGAAGGSTIIIQEGDTVTGASTLAGLTDTNVAGATAGQFLRLLSGSWTGFSLFAGTNTWTAQNTYNNVLRIAGVDSGFIDFQHNNTDLIATGSVTGALELSNFDLRFGNAQGVLWYDVGGTPTELLAFESAGSATSPDPNIASVVALFNAENAAPGAQTLPANIGNSTMARVSTGVAEVSTDFAKFGTRSIKTQYTGGLATGIWQETAKNTDLDLGAQDFTIEFWIYATAILGTQYIRYDDLLTGTQRSWHIAFTLSGNLQFFISTNGGAYFQILAAIQGIGLDAWHHVAVTRQGSTFRLFYDGTLLTSGTDAGTLYSGSNQRLWWSNASSLSTWYLDDFRITKGVARYTGSFTPPTEPADDGSFVEFMTVGDPNYGLKLEANNVEVTSNVDVTGNVTLTGTVDGRDVATDGATLDAHVALVGEHHVAHSGEVTGDYNALALAATAISNKTALVDTTISSDDEVLVLDISDGTLKKATITTVADGGYF